MLNTVTVIQFQKSWKLTAFDNMTDKIYWDLRIQNKHLTNVEAFCVLTGFACLDLGVRLVSEAMGGAVELEKLHEFSWVLHLSELKFQLRSNLIPIGLIRKGIYCHRALLFKVTLTCLPHGIIGPSSHSHFYILPCIFTSLKSFKLIMLPVLHITHDFPRSVFLLSFSLVSRWQSLSLSVTLFDFSVPGWQHWSEQHSCQGRVQSGMEWDTRLHQWAQLAAQPLHSRPYAPAWKSTAN